MNILVVPLFALSRMGGPWSRAQSVARAFVAAGHHVVLGLADDGNCLNPCTADVLELPVPSPLGLPMAIASRTFPIAEKLGISGRKPVRSFEEVLWLTGALAHDYERRSVVAIGEQLVARRIDAVYSEFSIPAIIAARMVGVPVFGSFSYTTQASFASNPEKAGGVRKLLDELHLPDIASSLDLFGWLDKLFVPSCRALEPIDDGRVKYVGFMNEPPPLGSMVRDCILVYLGSGSVPRSMVERIVTDAFHDFGGDVFVAGCKQERRVANVRFAPRFDFSELLPRACCFVNHGGQNSVMDALAYAVPQVVVSGRVFERIYNAESVERAGAGVVLERFEAAALARACTRIAKDPAFGAAAVTLRDELARCGGASAIVSSIESALSAGS